MPVISPRPSRSKRNLGALVAGLLAVLLLGPLAPLAGQESARTPALVLKGHAQGVFHVTCSRDGKLFATSSKDDTARIWDAVTGKELQVLKGHSDDVYSTAFSPDSKLLASASDDHTIRLWDVASGKELKKLEGHAGDVYHVAFSPDGQTLASCGDDLTVRLWDVATGNQKFSMQGHTDRILTVAFSPDGSRLVSSCATTNRSSTVGGEVVFWDVATGKEVYALPARNQGIISVAFSPDGRRVAGACMDKKVKVWELATGKEVLVLGDHSQEAYHVAFSPDGRLLASCGGKWNEDKPAEVKIWDLAAGKELTTLGGYDAPIWTLCFTPDGKRLATSTGKWDKTEPGEARIWDVADLKAALLPGELTHGQLSELWDDLISPDVLRAYHAVCKLSAAPGSSLPYLDKNVKPVISPASADRIARLIAQLDDETYAVREQATEELGRLGQMAFPALRQALPGGSVEVKRRINDLLDRKGDAPPLTPEELRAMRTIEVLVRLNRPECRPLLERLAGGTSSGPVVAEAKCALDCLRQRGR